MFQTICAYFKTSHLTAFFFGTLLILSLLKYVRAISWGKTRNVFFKLIFILLIGLSLRIAWIGFSSHRPLTSWSSKSMQESDLTNVHAIEVARGIYFRNADGTPSGRRPIGYPLALGGLYKIFGVYPAVPLVFHLFLYVASAILIFLMGRLIFGDRAGLLACLLFSIYPVSIYSSVLIVDEHLFLPLWYLGLFLLMREFKGIRLPLGWLWYGLLFGYATMTRTHAIFMPVVVGLTGVLMKRSWQRTVSDLILVALVMQLMNIPWVLRNQRAWGVPVLYTATNQYLYPQLNSTATAEGGGHVPVRGEEDYSAELEQASLSGNEGVHHSVAGKQMMRWVARHPARFTVMGIERVLVLMRWDRKQGVWPIWYQFYEGAYDPLRPIPQRLKDLFEETAFAFYYGLFFTFVFSCFLIHARRKILSFTSKAALGVIGGCFILYFLEQMAVYPDRKYRFPLEPLMMIPAAYYLEYWIRDFRWESLPIIGIIMRHKNRS